MKTYDVKGMSCAACSARVESAVGRLEGVARCSVNLLTNSMQVEGAASEAEVIAAVRAAGYDAAPRGAAKKDEPADDGSRELLRRLIASAILLLPLIYLSMGHVMWGFPLPAPLAANPLAVALCELLLSGAILVVHRRFFIGGFRGVLHRAPNMDALVALGSGASFVYSLAALFSMSGAALREGAMGAHAYLHDLWFESAAMILVLISLGKFLEARAKGKTTSAIRALLDLSPKTARVRREGREILIPASEVRVGDIFLVRTGEAIPADGVVLSGSAAIDESALTGESLPQEKSEGSRVCSATACMSGYLECEAQKVGEDTTIAGVIRLVSDAAGTKAPIASLADRVAGIFVPAVIGASLLTFAVWMLIGSAFSLALTRAVSVLVISCPCALGLATPVAIMVGGGVGAKHGVLYKTALSLETLGRVKTVVLDKTGTVTEGRMRLTDLVPSAGIGEDELLSLAASLEAKSEHPLAVAVVAEAARRGTRVSESGDFRQFPGGVCAVIAGETVRGGNLDFVRAQGAALPEGTEEKLAALARQGKTPLLFLRGERLLGIIALADSVKPDSAAAIAALRAMGIRTVMLTGDREECARAVADEVGIGEVIAGVLPDRKAEAVRSLLGGDKVAMIGDGINDAPALTVADVGVAIGAGTDVAIEAADVVLMRSGLSDAVAAVRIGRATLRNIRENLFWAFFYNVVGIPLAAGAFAPLGLAISPMFGAAAMSLSSVTVVGNALRLNLLKPELRPAGGRRPEENESLNIKENNENESEESSMNETKIIRVEGMMCPHCEARVKAALEAIDGVSAAAPDHKSASVALTLARPVAEEELRAAVEGAGYKFG